MTNLRTINVLSVTQYEEEMSRFHLGLCSLTLMHPQLLYVRAASLHVKPLQRTDEIHWRRIVLYLCRVCHCL